MKPSLRHKRRLIRYRRRGFTIFGTFKFPDGHYGYQLAKYNYNYVPVDSLNDLWQRGHAEITLQYWREADRRIRAGYEGLSVELGKVLDAQAGLQAALASATPRVDEFAEQHGVVIGYNFEAAEYPTHLDELENPRTEHYYFSAPELDEAANRYGEED